MTPISHRGMKKAVGYQREHDLKRLVFAKAILTLSIAPGPWKPEIWSMMISSQT